MAVTKYAIFDFAGTLATLSPSREEILLSLLEMYGVHDRTHSEIARAYWFVDSLMSFSSVSEASDSSYREVYYAKYNKLLLQELKLLEDIPLNKVHEKFKLSGSHWVPFSDATDSLIRLTDLEIPVGILSNFGTELSVLVRSIFNNNVDFSHVVASAAVGLEKPTIAFYEYFLSKIGIEVKNCVFIGDSYELDFEPANKIGLETYLVNRGWSDHRARQFQYESLTSIVDAVIRKNKP
jgi:FMN phosphatase YigB (HAD superfamily)